LALLRFGKAGDLSGKPNRAAIAGKSLSQKNRRVLSRQISGSRPSTISV
jgi:hypothetical protein